MFFSVFPIDTFSAWKMETKLCGNLRSCGTHLIELECIDQNPQTIPKSVEQFSIKLSACLFHSPWKRWGKGSNIFGKKYELILSPSHWIENPFEFHVCLQPFARSFGQIVQNRRK